MTTILLSITAAACFLATVVWARSATYRLEHLRRIQRDEPSEDETTAEAQRRKDIEDLARSNFLKETHSAVLYLFLALASAGVAATNSLNWTTVYLMIAVPALVSAFWWGRNSLKDALTQRERFDFEKRVEETLSQAELAPKAWADRLAPDRLAEFAGFDTGRVYQAGSGLMAGDFYDFYQVAPNRYVAVLGDVSGHGVDSAITAFLVKFLLRIHLKQYRDPAQAIEELHTRMYDIDRPEEFVSLVVLMFDIEAHTLRYASAGHPTAWLWHDREVQPLRSTGPLVLLYPDATFYSKEIPLHPDDLVVLYSDGLSEARREGSPDDQTESELFGQDRVGRLIRNDPTLSPQHLCQLLLEEAQKFARGRINDDLAIFAVRWTGQVTEPEPDAEPVAVQDALQEAVDYETDR